MSMFKSKTLYQSSSAFRWMVFGIVFFALISLFRTIFGWLDVFLESAPDWFFHISFVFFLMYAVSILGILQLKKWGVILYPILLFAELFYYMMYGHLLIDAVTGVFFYIGFGLISIIENWKKFS